MEVAEKLKQDYVLKSTIITPLDNRGIQVRDTVSRVLRELGIYVILPEEDIKPDDLFGEWLLNALFDSDFVVADITQLNPSVMYELGIAHGRRTPTLLIISEEERYAKIPSDLLRHLYIIYDPADLRSLEYNVKLAAKRLITELKEE